MHRRINDSVLRETFPNASVALRSHVPVLDDYELQRRTVVFSNQKSERSNSINDGPNLTECPLTPVH